MSLPERPSDMLLKDTRYGDVVLQCVLADIYRHKTLASEYKLAFIWAAPPSMPRMIIKLGGRQNVDYMRSVVEQVMKCSVIKKTLVELNTDAYKSTE